jgi:hypothetical protein
VDSVIKILFIFLGHSPIVLLGKMIRLFLTNYHYF